MSKPKVLIVRTAGTNCDAETAHAFELAGATPVSLHLNRLLENPRQLADHQILAIPGGFSYGDDIAAGRILANQLSHHLKDALADFLSAGKPVIGVCNGFQVLVKAGLLPGNAPGGRQTCTLAHNDSGRFADVWVHLVSRSSKCVWTAGLEPMELPIAHGEGKFVPADESARRGLWENEQVALTYAKPDGSPAAGECTHNPNGSIDDIAGICDASGLVFGLMPHPERYVAAQQHPAWAARAGAGRGAAESVGRGLRIFENAVRHVTSGVGAGV
jgi:phosphoribosylformylglycinamidine synthase subunit PurQ / glutaminase